MQQFTVVSYDISNDKRRLMIMKTLEDFGTRVQYSVFECRLNRDQMITLKRRLKPLVSKKDKDSIRFYHISADDVGRIEIFGHGNVTKDRVFYMQ